MDKDLIDKLSKRTVSTTVPIDKGNNIKKTKFYSQILFGDFGE